MKKLVLVGNGMAGMRAIEELLKIAPDLYQIIVFGAEPHPNYNRILLSPVLAGEQTLEQIVLNPLQWYRDNGITLHLGRTVTTIDRTLTTTTGSPPRTPAMPRSPALHGSRRVRRLRDNPPGRHRPRISDRRLARS